MTDNIDTEVAAFARDLDGLAAFDTAQIAADLSGLVAAVITATSHESAAVAVREFVDLRTDAPKYVQAVITALFAQLGVYIAFLAPMDTLSGDEGTLRRLQRLAYTVRGLGFADEAWMRGTL